MAIRHKSIYDPVDPAKDGYRLLVTRYWPRGVKKERVHSWERHLGAPEELIRKKKLGKLSESQLKKIYLAYLSRETMERALALVRGKNTVTLLCTCRDHLCHRVVLAEVLARQIRQSS